MWHKKILLSFALFGAKLSLASFEISPITASLAPSGPKAVASYVVTNTSNHKLAVQIYIVPREPGTDGKEIYKVAAETDAQFQIYPSQLVLNVGDKRTVRVTWKGPSSLSKELSFRMISEEMPFEMEDPAKAAKKFSAHVNIASKYVGSIYITPNGAQPSLAVKATPEIVKGQPAKLHLDFENSGTAHFVLQKIKVTLSPVGAKGDLALGADQLQLLYNQNVLAGKTRRFVLPWPANLPVGPVKVAFEALKD